jgi:hypothetical protein
MDSSKGARSGKNALVCLPQLFDLFGLAGFAQAARVSVPMLGSRQGLHSRLARSKRVGAGEAEA